MSEIKGFFGDQVLGGGDADGIDLRRIMSAIDDLWDHKDELIRLASKLPPLLGDAGEMMHLAGQGAERASGFLTGEVREIAGTAAHVLATSTAQLKNVLTVLDNIGRALKQVPFLDDLGDMITDGLEAIMGVADNVSEVSGRVRALGERLGDVGSDLGRMGQSLVGGGAMLADFGGKPVRPIATFTGLPPLKQPPVRVKPVKVTNVTKVAKPAVKVTKPVGAVKPAKPVGAVKPAKPAGAVQRAPAARGGKPPSARPSR